MAAVVGLAFLGDAHARVLPDLPSDAPAQHLGVAKCAGVDACHGARARDTRPGIRHDEHYVWGKDPHSRAFTVLTRNRSQEIVRKLGLSADARSTPLCLACHSDDVPESRRGKLFRVNEGVGCEACHGGAQSWVETHYSRSHAQNVRDGMYPTDDPWARARLCLSCHLGTADKIVDHRLYAAGHPRLVFELDLWTSRYAHYEADADYRKRHGALPSHATVWAVGQVAAARRALDLFLGGAGSPPPEFALYECYDCHHDIGKRAASSEPSPVAGLPRFNDASLRMLRYAAPPGERAGLEERLRSFQGAVTTSQATAGARVLLQSVDGIAGRITADTLGPDEAVRILRAVATDAREGKLGGYLAAEQAMFAVANMVPTITSARPASASDKRAEALLRKLGSETASAYRLGPGNVATLLGDLAELFD